MFRQFSAKAILPVSSRVAPNVRCLSYSRANQGIVDSAKDILDKANKKTGEVLANTIETTEKKTPSAEQVKDATTNAASAANQKAGEVLVDGIEKAENASEKVKGTAEELKGHAEAKRKVLKNTHGYKDLQDKGSKVESEQNRPDDAV